MIFERTTTIVAPLAAVFDFFSIPTNLSTITPPAVGFRIVASPGRKLREGDRIEYRFRILGLSIRWISCITSWRENESFADLQERGPFKYWLHTHTFLATATGVEMHDRVEYELPLGILGRIAGGWFVRHELRKAFDYRAETLRRLFS